MNPEKIINKPDDDDNFEMKAGTTEPMKAV